MNPQTAIIVPARLASTRFPNKLLHPIQGKSLILHVAERIRDQAPEIPLFFAIEDTEIEDELGRHGFECLMTSNHHTSGTDRLAEANRKIGAQYVINIQGDEPLVTEEQINQLRNLVEKGAAMGTLASVFVDPDDFADPNQVKVIVDRRGYALYFSRAPIPYFRSASGKPSESDLTHHLCYRHLGMYAYQANFLESFSSMPPGKLERLERLEQLRALENGTGIAVAITADPSIGVDTLEDAADFEKLL